MNQLLKQTLAGIAVAALLATGGVALAGAADPDTTAPSGTTATTGGTSAADPGSTRTGGLPRRAIAEAAFESAAETIGVTAAELREQVRGGNSVAAVAEAHGVDPASVTAALLAAGTEWIDRALADGQVDAGRAAALADRLPQVAERFVNRSRPTGGRQQGQEQGEGQGQGQGQLRRRLREAALAVAAETIGIAPEELRAEIRGGRSAAQVAEAHGVSPDAVGDAVTAAATERIEEALAAGRIDAERAAALEQRLPEVVQRLLDFVPGRQR